MTKTKWLERTLLGILLVGVLMAPQTSQVNSYVNGNVLTADQLNSEFGNLYSTINGLDEDNFLDTTVFPAKYVSSSIAGNGLDRDSGTGVLEVGVDNSTIEINTDILRIKNLGVTGAKIANGTIAGAKLATDITIAADPGSAGTPSYTFTGDTNTGLYTTGADAVGVSLGGALKYGFSAGQIQSPNGTGGAPTYSFASTPDLGMYRVGALSLGVSVGGSLRSEFTSGGQKLYGQFQSENGTAGTPTYGFADENGNGLYKSTSNVLGISTGGTNRLLISDGGINMESGGYFKVKVFTGTIAGSGAAQFTSPGTLILAAQGYSSRAGGSNWAVITDLGSNPGDAIHFNIDAGGTTNTISNKVELLNQSGSTNSYRLVMFYQ